MGSESEPREDEVSAVKTDTEGNTRRATARRVKGWLFCYLAVLLSCCLAILLSGLPANNLPLTTSCLPLLANNLPLTT